MKTVHVQSVYVYNPVMIDIIDCRNTAMIGEVVRVINLPNAPKANSMKHCYIQSLNGDYRGMVHVDSLVKSERI